MEAWHALPQGPLFRSAQLDCALSCISGAMLCEENGEKLLALPYDEDAPFPLPELFCFARVGSVRGERCVIYRLNRKNSPIFWEK